MKVKDIMTWNVVSVTPDTPIMEARKIMETHKVIRLPVVDRGKLVGIVTLDRIIGAGASPSAKLAVWEADYLLAKMKIADIMRKDPVTVTTETTIEQSLVISAASNAGMLPVLDEDGHMVGVVTTTDYALKVLNPALGIHKKGVKLLVTPCTQPAEVYDLMKLLKGQGAKLVTCHTDPETDEGPGYAVMLDTKDASKVITALESGGFKVQIVKM